MKKRETIYLFLHIFVGAGLAALVCFNFWFVVLTTFIYTWLREQAQHRWIHTQATPAEHETVEPYMVHKLYTRQKQTFFGWMTWHRMWEVFQWTLGAAVACGIWEIFGD
jgi:hypothetical protein